MRHNEHEVARARKMAKAIGVDLIRFIPVRLIPEAPAKERIKMAENWFPKNKKYRRYVFDEFGADSEYLHKKGCFHLYRSLAIYPDGSVLPCNIIYKHSDSFGNLNKDNFEDIWNNEYFKSARSLFATDKSRGREVACDRCHLFRKNRLSDKVYSAEGVPV